MAKPMNNPFTFAMGDFDANFPGDYLYAKNHMWALPVDAPGSPGKEVSRYRFGLTAYAVRLLQDVYFLEWIIETPAPLKSKANLGSIESKKAESDLFSPVAGILTVINDEVLEDPALINADPYGAGWMIEIEATAEEAAVLLSPEQYAEHLVDAWQVAQRTIKGQANT